MTTISNNMRQTAKRSTFKTDRDFRLTGRTSGERVARPTPVAIDLSIKELFPMVHQWQSEPMRFTINSTMPIPQHTLLRWKGVVYKVAGVAERPIEPAAREAHRIGEGVRAYEVKMVVFGRYQG